MNGVFITEKWVVEISILVLLFMRATHSCLWSKSKFWKSVSLNWIWSWGVNNDDAFTRISDLKFSWRLLNFVFVSWLFEVTTNDLSICNLLMPSKSKLNIRTIIFRETLYPHRSLNITWCIVLVRLLAPIRFCFSLRSSTSISISSYNHLLSFWISLFLILKHLSHHWLMMLLSYQQHIWSSVYL